MKKIKINLLEDFMKNFVSSIVLALLVGLFVSCASASVASTIGGVSNISAGTNESIVVIKRNNNFVGSAVGVDIFVDGQKVASVGNGQETTFTVQNGRHTIYAARSWNGDDMKSGQITFEVQSQKITFAAGFGNSGVELIRGSIVVLEENENNRSTATGVEGALARAADETLKNVQQRSKIAIVYITAQDRSTTEYIVGELEYIWVNKGYFITDRSQLDRLRREQNFQMSGEVDDDTAVSIGKFAGADIIVTGRVDGEGNLRRLRLRALNTQTAQVVGVASERL
jgi:hypothetical protein